MKIKCISLLLIAFLFNGLTVLAQSWLWGEQSNGLTAPLKEDLTTENVATNKTGNIYQTGTFENSISFGTYNFTSSAVYQLYLVKYDQNGNVLWARQSTTPNVANGYAGGYSVATDDSDNSYVIGYIWDYANLGSYSFYLPSGDMFLAKYDPNGNILWVTAPDGGPTGYAVALDKFGNEYVTGVDAFLMKFDRNGNIIWSFPQAIDPDNFSTFGSSVTVDISGNVYVSGQFSEPLTFGTYQLYSTNPGVFIAKFDSNGNVLWAQQSTNNSRYSDIFNGAVTNYSVAVDRLGAVYLIGTFVDTITFGSYTFTSPNESTNNFFVVKYNPNGTIVWGKEATPVNSSSWGTYSICTDDSSHIYISGAEGASGPASFVFANDTITADTNNYDAPSFLLKLDSSGNIICASTLSAGGGAGNAVTSDSIGKFVYLGGGFWEPLALGFDSLKNNSGGLDSYVGRWQTCFDCDSSAITITQQGNVLTSSATQINQWLRNDTALQGAINQNYTVTTDGWYKVIYTNPSNGCSYTSDSIYVTYIPPAGVNQFSVYPNPTNNQIVIKINSSSTDLTSWNLKLIDILGRTIYSMPSLNYSNIINLQTLPAAMYFISVTNNTGRTVVPVVKVN